MALNKIKKKNSRLKDCDKTDSCWGIQGARLKFSMEWSINWRRFPFFFENNSSDGGPQFTEEETQDLLRVLIFFQRHAWVPNPHANGRAEFTLETWCTTQHQSDLLVWNYFKLQCWCPGAWWKIHMPDCPRPFNTGPKTLPCGLLMFTLSCVQYAKEILRLPI